MELAPVRMVPETPQRSLPIVGVPPSRDVIHFASFTVVPSSRLLLRDGVEIPIGGRAFDLLLALLASRGELVDKDTIANIVWPCVTVDESNIRFQIGVLRKALGADGCLIKTIPGRGYLFADTRPALAAPSDDLRKTSAAAERALPTWLRCSATDLGFYRAENTYVAVIDDDPTVLESMVGLIQCAGFNAEPFPSTIEFLESCQTCAPSCIVLDAWLPGQGGLDFQACLVSSGIRIPIVFISGHGDVAMSVRAVKAGAFDFLTKPVRYEDLLQAIGSAVSSAA